MACCDEHTTTGAVIDMSDLPEETFCCMGRMAYVLAARADELLCGTKHPTWDSLNERQKLEMGGRAKSVVCGGNLGNTPFEQLMQTVIQAMATAS